RAAGRRHRPYRAGHFAGWPAGRRPQHRDRLPAITRSGRILPAFSRPVVAARGAAMVGCDARGWNSIRAMWYHGGAARGKKPPGCAATAAWQGDRMDDAILRAVDNTIKFMRMSAIELRRIAERAQDVADELRHLADQLDA